MGKCGGKPIRASQILKSIRRIDFYAKFLALFLD